MYYVGIKDNEVDYMVSYEPAQYDGITIYKITDEEALSINQGKSYYDIQTNSVIKKSESVLQQEEEKIRVAELILRNRRLLNTTDWKVLRHIREKALGTPTSLSDEEYLLLEQERASAASQIKNNGE